jgi:DNA-binding NarL/FixJ family response regulator
MSGFAALKEVSRLHPDLPVIILTCLPEEQYAAAALRTGAAAFLTKERAPRELPAVVRRALEGRNLRRTCPP